MKTFEERDFSDKGEEAIDYDTGEVIEELPKAGKNVVRVILKAEAINGKLYANRGKQAKYISQMFKSGFTEKQILAKFEEMRTSFYKSFDFSDVANEIGKVDVNNSIPTLP